MLLFTVSRPGTHNFKCIVKFDIRKKSNFITALFIIQNPFGKANQQRGKSLWWPNILCETSSCSWKFLLHIIRYDCDCQVFYSLHLLHNNHINIFFQIKQNKNFPLKLAQIKWSVKVLGEKKIRIEIMDKFLAYFVFLFLL